MQVQGAFNLLFRPGLRADFRDNYVGWEEEFSYFLKVGSTTLPETSATIMTGPARFLERGDGESVTYEYPKIGPKVMGVDREFALGFIITRKTVEDDQYGKASQGAKWLAKAANLTKEYKAAALLDDAFTGTNFKGIDNLALCHTAHTVINSSTTVANRPTQEVGFSNVGITAMMDLFGNMKDENGDPMKIWPDTLIIGNDAGDINRATQIFQSPMEPYTANNADNAIKRRLSGMKPPFVSHYKTSRKSYFMIDSKNNDAWFLNRRAIEFTDTFDFDTDAAKYKGSMRFLIWFVDWRGWCGCNPA